MRVMGNISKKVKVAILSASMAMTPAVGTLAVPMTVCAEAPDKTGDIANNYEDIGNYSHGTIGINYWTIGAVNDGGNVDSNRVTIDAVNDGGNVNENLGTIGAVNNGGTVDENRGTINAVNDGGNVNYNTDTIGAVNNGGTVEHNENTITNNFGTVTSNTGTVTNNYGTVGDNTRTVANNFGTVTSNTGTITNNYGGEVTGGTVQNQFWKVFLEGDQRYSATYGTGFVGSSDQEDPHKYIQVTSNGAATENSGTVTFDSKSGYKLSGNVQANQNSSNEGVTFTYTTVKNANGSYSITISSLNGNLYLTPESVQLVLSAIPQPSNDESTPTPSNIVANDDGSVTVSVNSTNANTEIAAVQEGRTMFAVPNAKGEATATVGTTRVTVSYGQCNITNAIETFVTAPVNEEATKYLEDYANTYFPGKKIVVRVKARLYKSGVSVNEFGVLTQSYHIGNGYDGQTVSVAQIHKDGTITVTEVPVVNGKVIFTVTDLGTFFLAI